MDVGDAEIPRSIDQKDSVEPIDPKDGMIEDVTPNTLQQSSFASSIYNIICTIVGAGMLGIPYALRQSSWYGLFMLTGVWLAMTYSGVRLAACFVEDPELDNYSDLGEKAFGRAGVIVAAICQHVTCVGVGIIFIILSGTLLELIFESSIPQMNNLYWSMITAGLLIPLLFLRTLHDARFIALFGVLSSLVAVIVIFVNSLIVGRADNIEYGDITFQSFAQSFATFAFAFAGHPVFPSIQRVMKKPSKFPLSVIISLACIFCTYVFVAVVGYYTFGTTTAGNILDSLPNNWGNKLACAALVLHLLFAFVVVMNPVYRDIERGLGLRTKKGYVESAATTAAGQVPNDDDQKPTADTCAPADCPECNPTVSCAKCASSKPTNQPSASRFMTYLRKSPVAVLIFIERVLVLGLMLFIALLIPFFIDVMGLIGGTTNAFSILILPLAFDLRIHWGRMPLRLVILNFTLIVVGIIAGFTASAFALKNIIANAGTYGVFTSSS